MKLRRGIALVASCASILFACGVDYNKIMQAKVRASLGNDYSGYQSFSYPTDNFGIATMYTSPTGTTVSDNDFLCDTWNCLGIVNPPSDAASQLSVSGFAAVGNSGAAISLSEQQQRDIALNAVLPQIYQVINVSGGFSSKNVTKTTLQIGQAFPRKLRRQVMKDYLDQKAPPGSLMKQAYNAGNLTLVVADVVVDRLTVQVDVNNSAATNLNAALGGVKSKVFSDSKLGVTLSSSTTGTYTFDITKPVIILRLAKRQPSAGGLGAATDDEWNDWVPVTLPRTTPSTAAKQTAIGR